MSDGAPALACRGLMKSFNGVRAVDGFDLDVPTGSLTALLGASGCGKTTALRLIAGLERPDGGAIQVRGRLVAGNGAWVPPERRRVGMVFQEWALFPHLDVEGNVAFGVDEDAAERVGVMLELAQLGGLAHRMPHELSGGQQQRVALARALAPRPDLLLLDEPFSNLDAQLRADVRSQVRDILAATGTTAVFVTHDQEEALSIADRIAVMVDGSVRQTASPFEIYTAPRDARVARLVGQVNLIDAEVVGGLARSSLGEVPVPGMPEGPCELLVRPESVEIVADQRGEVRVIDVEFYGHDQLVRCMLPGGDALNVRLIGAHPDLRVGSTVRLALLERPRALPI